MNVEVRLYKDDDYDAVNRIILMSFGYEKSKINDDKAHEFVACIDNKVVGYLILNEMKDIIKNIIICHIDYVCVDLEYRGQKIGKKMMECVISYAKEKGVSRIELTSNPKRVAAHKLYENCGFIKRDTDVFRKELV